MEFGESDELTELRRMVRSFSEKELAPCVAEWDRDEYFPKDINKKFAELGLLGGVVDPEYGGSGMSFVQMTAVMDEMGYYSPMAAVVCGQPSFSLGAGILTFGTEDQKYKYLTPTLKGELVGAVAVTEAHSGTDIVRKMNTSVRKEGDHYVLNGSKVWVSNLNNADWFITFGTIDRDRGHKGVCAFIVEREFPGVSAYQYMDKVGSRTMISGELAFNDVRVPAENLVGLEGEGYKVLMAGTEIGRLAVSGRAVGQLRKCLDLAVKYAKERVVSDNEIGRYQLIQEKIASMSVDLQAASLLVYKLAWLLDQGHTRLQKEAAIAKLYATDALMRATTETMQIYGAYSCSNEYEIGRLWRDAKFMQIFDGTSEIQKVIIAEHELGYRKS